MNHNDFKTLTQKARAFSTALDNRDAQEREMQAARLAAINQNAMQSRPYTVDERAFGVARTATAPTTAPITTIGPSGMTFGTPFGTMQGQMAQTEYNRPLYSVGFSPNARPAQTAEDVQRIQSNAPTFGNMLGKVMSSPAGLQTQIEKLEKERFKAADNMHNANSEESRQAAQAVYDDINAQIEALTKQLDGALPSVPETIDGMTYVEAALDVSNKRSVGIYDPEAEARLEKFHTAQRIREDTEKYGTKLYNDDFSGQFGASFTNTTIAERANAAWARYADNPTEANRQVAENLSRLQEEFGRNNRNALDENATLPIVSQTLAGYLPQGLRQGAAMAVGGLAGAAIAGGAGAKVGMTIGSGVASYNSMKGAAFKTLIDLGVDEQTARAAANDEAVLSSIIEMGETGITVFTAGANKLLQAAGKAGITSLGKVLADKVGGGLLANLAVALGKYGINILSEGEEERLQQYISLANQKRMTEGNVDGGAWGLAKDTAGLIGDALRGEAPEAREQASEAASEGRKLAALTGIFDVPANTVGGMQTGAQARQERNTQAAVQMPQTAAPQTAEPAQAAQAVTPEQKPEAQPVQTPKTTAQIMEEAARGMVGKPDDLESRFVKFVSDRGGSVTADQMAAFAETLSEADMENLAVAVEEAANGGKLKWRSDGSIALPPSEADHIDQRDLGSVGSPKVKAFQYNNPEMHQYIREGAELFGADLANTTVGERFYLGNNPSEAGATPLWKGVKRHTTPYIAELKDNYGMSYAALDKAVEDLIADSGRENNAGAKRVELMIDRMLTKGYRALDGTYYPPNEAYIAAKQKIHGGSDTADGVGAKTSDFKHRVVNSQNHALGGVEVRNAVPENLRTQTTHDEITEAESLHNANLRLEQDYEGEKRYLENTVSWTGEDVDVGMKILEDLSREAHNTGDWTEYTRWRKVFDLHKEEIGRSLQALAKYARLTGDRIIENASKLLDDARDGTDVSEVMDTVAAFSAAFDEAAAKKDVDQLVQIIRDTAQTRNMSGLVRSVFGKSGLPKEIDWAINRIAELAVGDLQKYEANPTAAPVVRRFSVGDRVSPSDRNNVGTIVADHGDGTYSVRFVNQKTKTEATKKFSVEQLQSADKTKKNSLSFPAEKHDVGKYYDFLKKFAANSIEAIAADKKKLSGGKAAKTLRYNAMLSKASTVLRNLVNNGVLDGLDTLARDVSAVLDMAISRLTKTRSVAVDKGWFSEAKRKGALDGLAFALMESGLDVDTSGSYNKYENGAGRTFKMSGSPVERLLSSWEKLTAYNMSVTDEVSKGATEAEIQRGIDELRAKGKIKDDSLGGAGAQEARYRTLQDDTVLSKAASKIREVGNDIYSIDGFGLGDFALPFTKVPANVPMRVIDYSPAGLATGMYRMAQALKSAKDGTLTAAEQARAVQSIGRGMTGTAVIAGLTALAAKGLIRTMDAGGKEENRDRAASLKSQGLSGTQWNLAATLRDAEGKESGWKHGDTILSVGFLEPFNAHMAIASLIAEDMKDGLTAGEIITDTLSGTVQAVLELPVMQVLQDAANAYRYSDGETAGERFLDAGKSFLAGQATSWIPNSLKGIAQGLDPMQRDLYASDNPLEQAVDNFKGSVPKLREQTSAKLDVYGNPVENENRAMNFLNANVNPGSVGTYQTTPTTDVLNRVYDATGESSVYLSSSDLSEVKDVALDESQKRQFQTDRGDTYEAVVPAIGGDKNFWNLPNDMQVAILSVAEEYATQTAKEKLGVGYETESWVQELAGKSAEEIARECIKKGVERVGGLGKPIKFDASWAVVSGDVMDGAMKKAQAYADAVALEEMGYPMETDWMLEAKEAKTDKERQDLFMAEAVDAQAKKVGDGKKYVGLSEMLEDGDVDDKTAILVLPTDVVKRKTDRKIKVSATLLVDALAFSNSDAASSGKKDKNGKYLDGEGPQDKVLEYLRKDRRLPASQVNKVMACLYEGWDY